MSLDKQSNGRRIEVSNHRGENQRCSVVSAVCVDPAMFSLLLLTILSGIITTATFTLMMRRTRLVPPGVQATHYTVLATCEVVGKLAFTSLCGWMADVAGYRLLFLIFAVLSTVVLPCFGRITSESVAATGDESELSKTE